jgi:hypothetical protein
MIDRLHINVIDDEIVVTMPGTRYSVTYYRSEDQHHLRVKNYAVQVGQRAKMAQAEFLGKAWRVAKAMACHVGWTSS